MRIYASFRRGVFRFAPAIARLLLVLLLGLLAVSAGAAPTPDPLTGHYYEEITTGKTWDQARVDAALLVLTNQPGHLATINNLNENLIVQHLGGTGEKWIGLTDSTATSTLDGFNLALLGTSEQGNTSGLPLPAAGVAPVIGERGSGFQWITGEPYTFLNWRPGAPGGSAVGNDGVYVITQGVWQDAAAGTSVGEAGGPTLRRSVVEYDVALSQERFRVTERLAAPTFNGNGSVPNLAEADRLLALSDTHADIFATATNRAYVLSFHDPDLGGGLFEFVRAPIFLNAVGVNENDIVFRASAQVVIPQAGEWTFAVASGDPFRLNVGSNKYTGDGVLPTTPPRLTRPGLGGNLNAATGGSGETFYFPQAGVYDLYLTTLDSGFYAFYQVFAAPGNQTNYSAAEFDLVGDVLNGGLEITCQPRVPGTLALTLEMLAGGTMRVSWNSRPCATYRLEFSETLAGWQALVGGIHPAAAFTSMDHIPGTMKGFYRLVEWD